MVEICVCSDMERLSRDFDLPSDHIIRNCLVDVGVMANKVLNTQENWSLANLVLNQVLRFVFRVWIIFAEFKNLCSKFELNYESAVNK